MAQCQIQPTVTVTENGSIVGWLDKKSRHLKQWRTRWIVLYEGKLKSYKNQNGEAQTECIDLKKYSNVCKSGSLTFDIYDRNKIAFSFRSQGYDITQSWIKHIIHAKQYEHISNIPEQKQLFKQPKPIKAKQNHSTFASYSATVEDEDELIHRNLRMYNNKILRARFAHKRGEKHPELLVYGDEPEFDDDQVIRIDLVCVEDDITNRKQNKVRLQCETWGKLKNRDCDELEFPILKSLEDITAFCVEYQEKNAEYNYSGNNCRKFIIELCKYLEIKYPHAYPLEDKWYGIREASQIFKRKKNDDALSPVAEIKDNEEDVKYNDDDAKDIDEISVSSVVMSEEKYDKAILEQFEQLNTNQMIEQLYHLEVLKHYSGSYFSSSAYEELKDLVPCFIETHQQQIINNKMIEFKVILVKSDEKNTENDRYFYYVMKTSYDELKIIDDSLNRINPYHGNDRYKKEAQNVTAFEWITKQTKPPLLHPYECRNGLIEYATYLQVLFCLAQQNYIYKALKFPDKFSILLQSVTKQM